MEHPELLRGLFHSEFNGGISMDGGIEEDAAERVAKEVEGFDAIFFGHDHMVHNEMLKSPSGRDVLCLNPSCYALNVVEATIKLMHDKDRWVVKEIKGEIVDVRNEEVDEQMVARFQPTIDAIKEYVGRSIGSFDTTIGTRDSYFGPSAFTDFVHQLQLQITGADVSFNAPLSFDSQIKAGPITVADMFKLYRFENQLYVVKMTGREIRGHLELSYSRWVNTMKSPDDHIMLLADSDTDDKQRYMFKNLAFNFDSAAGIDYVVDVTRPDGEKVKILRMSNGEPFSEDKWYKVAMNSYRGNGGGELLTLGAGISHEEIPNRIIYQSEKDQRYYLTQEIEKAGVLHPKAHNNWRFVPDEWAIPAIERDKALLFNK